MPDASFESGLVPDPRHDPVPWGMYGLGVAGFGVLVGGWWAGASTTGIVQSVFRVVAVVGGVYGVYMLGLSAGWQVFSRALERRMNRTRLRTAAQDQGSLLELRFGGASDQEPSLADALMDDLNAEMDGAGECGEAQVSGGGAVTYYVHGHDLDQMVAIVTRVAARFPLPADAYLWVPSPSQPGFGTVLRARQD